jgi:Zn-dependent protease with chaperone function/uncharacterized tellurite resistance protein B-like protein
MAMDFFESQDQARKNTGRLVVLFSLAVLTIVVAVYLLISGLLVYAAQEESVRDLFAEQQPTLWNLELLLYVAWGTLVVVAGGSLYKILQLRAGGTVIAEALGGRRIYPDSTDPVERKVLNVVEEMAIASGTPAPPVFLLDQEPGINAFAAGFTPGDAVIGVTAGTAKRLTRDELQGVIAHEFSHILNGDMRLNIRLIGILHGILIIGILGFFILRSALYSGVRSSGRRRGGPPFPIIALGIGLLVIGYAGTFFGRLIQSAVSRQREFLADAAAVQFTRNPAGIAGALKKIGGFATGSEIQSPNAPEVSHMFFGKAISSFLGGMFATHPPLPERISRIDPSWKGEFPEIETDELGALPEPAAAGFAGQAQATAAAPAAAAPAAAAPATPFFGVEGRLTSAQIDDAVNHIGQPTEAHLGYAAQVLRNIPPPVIAAAREPYGARALVYAMLIDRDPGPRAVQLERLAAHADAGVFQATERLLPLVSWLSPRVRLPLIDLAVPALRSLSPSQYRGFAENVRELVKADRTLDLFEWSLQRILLNHVQPEFVKAAPPRVKYKGLDRVLNQVQLLLSTLAYAGNPDPAACRAAFDMAAAHLMLPRLKLLPVEDINLELLGPALDVLNEAAPRLKQQLLKACIACVKADREITVSEAELLRAISDSLGVPLPPILPGRVEG